MLDLGFGRLRRCYRGFRDIVSLVGSKISLRYTYGRECELKWLLFVGLDVY